MIQAFTLTERFALGRAAYTWRLKESEIRFRGSGRFAGLVNQRIVVSLKQIAEFRAALDMLGVWSWRSDYSPSDIGFEVMDGSEWEFAASAENRQCKCGGGNGFPSFIDAAQTTTDHGRFACLITAMYECFNIQPYIHIAAAHRQRNSERDKEI